MASHQETTAQPALSFCLFWSLPAPESTIWTPATGRIILFPSDLIPLVEALAARAAIALNNLRL